jgi:hypothetical protein
VTTPVPSGTAASGLNPISPGAGGVHNIYLKGVFCGASAVVFPAASQLVPLYVQ